MSNATISFFVLITFVILQRLLELRLAKSNTKALLKRGATEFGRNHYWLLVTMHTLFFVSLLVEGISHPLELSKIWYFYIFIFALAQMGRIWVIRTLNGRWTTRILVLSGEKLVRTGPFQYISHPNYWVVAIELLVLPLIFNLYVTATAFSLLNAFVLLAIRLPVEKRALRGSPTGLH